MDRLDLRKDPSLAEPVDAAEGHVADPDRALWAQFAEAATAEALCQSWLALQCRMIGGGAALPGFLASLTSLPIIGVPINSSPLNGLDALLSIAQMPKGVPVATVAVGKWGAANAGILAAQILALSDANVRRRLAAFRKAMAAEVQQRSRRVAAELKRRQ